MIVEQIQRRANPMEISVCNNATWSSGEIALQLGAEIRPFVAHLLPHLVEIINVENMYHRGRTLQENAAITIGRLGCVCPEELAQHLDKFAGGWCRALRDMRDNLEKESAFLGMCKLVALNPSGVFTVLNLNLT
jgi:transportin-1